MKLCETGSQNPFLIVIMAPTAGCRVWVSGVRWLAVFVCFAGCMGYYGVSGVSDLYRHVSAVLGVGVQVPEPRFRV